MLNPTEDVYNKAFYQIRKDREEGFINAQDAAQRISDIDKLFYGRVHNQETRRKMVEIANR
jgi:hypothetical protein